MFRLEGGRPGDTRGFLHKSFIGRAIGGVAKRVISATPIGAALTTGFGLASSVIRRPTRLIAPRSATARPSLEGQQGKEFGRELKFGGADTSLPTFGPRSFGPPTKGASPCRSGESELCCRLRNGTTQDQRQWQRQCGTAGGGAGSTTGPTAVGDAVMGRYGAALEPGVMVIERSVCLAGMQLGDDGLCYNKGAITNSQRQWPRGRRPLLTGGDMRAIGIAARAGSKLDRTTKRLRSLGMMKALPRPRAKAHAHAKAATDVVSV